MAVLSDVRILEKIYDKKLIVEPFIYEHVQPASIDLTLDGNIKIPKIIDSPINIYDEIKEDYYDTNTINKYVIKPGEFILGEIRETITMPKNMKGKIENRNSLARNGLNISLLSYINPGYKGKLPIGIQNVGTFNIELVSGMRICQLVISEVNPEPNKDYSQRADAKYYDESGIQLSRMHLDAEFKDYLHEYNLKGDKIDRFHLSTFLVDRLKSKATNFINSLSDSDREKIGL